MKRKSSSWKNCFKIAVPVLILFFISGCSITNTRWSDLKFWQSDRPSGILDEKAVHKFVEKIRTRPGNPESHYLLAVYYQERGRYREAIIEYDKVLFIDPTYIKAYNGRGISLDQLGEHSQATKSFEQAIVLNAKLDYVWNNLCYSLLMQGEYQAAIESCQKALTLNQESKRIRNNLALAYAMAGQYNRAFQEFETAGNGDKLYAHLKMAVIYYDKAMFQQAIEQYQYALILDPASAKAKKGLDSSQQLLKVAEAATLQKNIEEAKAVQDNKINNAAVSDEKVLAVVDDYKAREQTEIARKLYEKGSFEKAQKHYEQAIVYDPTLFPAHKGLAAAKALTKIANIPSREYFVADLKEKKVKDGLIGQVGIEISNGNGKRHMARDIGKYLRANGFKIVRITNANNFNHSRGSIYYQKEFRALAEEIATKIPELSILQEMKRSVRPNVKVKVVLGKDLVAGRQTYRN